eukprot:scpid15878/ scgid16880/ Serine/threonine-protein kinase LMTK1; Apoptosis-associated tyrosine kinase; Brain apoptosis-associated tyrosine kinase; CDK5-binding protein; Lemur tyrosine kinase 1; p35-binding protein
MKPVGVFATRHSNLAIAGFRLLLLGVFLAVSSTCIKADSECEIDTSRRLILRNATAVAAVVKSCLLQHTEALSAANDSSKLPYRFLSELVVGSPGCLPSPATNFATFDWSSLEPLLTTFVPKLFIQCIADITELSTPFANVLSLAGIAIIGNAQLGKISAFSHLLSVSGDVELYENRNLLEATGFSHLQTIGGQLKITRNAELELLELPSLRELGGNDKLLSGQTLQITYNPKLGSLSGLRTLRTIKGGTVRIEGNHALCYPGYPQWSALSLATHSFVYPSSASVVAGVDWRALLDPATVPCGQFTWQEGIPSLLVRDNGPLALCGSQRCSSTCPSGCWSATNSSTCGVVYSASVRTPICTDPTPRPIVTSQNAPVATSNGASAGDVDSLSYWVPPWKMPGILVFVLVMLLSLALVILLAVLLVRCRRRRTRRLGLTDVHGKHATSRINEDLQDTSISMSTFPRVHSPVRASDKGHLLDDELVSDGFETRVIIGSADAGGYDEETTAGFSNAEHAVEDTQRVSPEGSVEQAITSPSDGVVENYPFSQIEYRGEMLGQTALWSVQHAMAKRLVPGLKRSPVIAMEIKTSDNKEDELAFAEQLVPMRLRHENVLRLLAMCYQDQSHIALCEPCGQGFLKTYMLPSQGNRESFVERGLYVKLTCDVASAVAFLHSNGLPYHDLAAHSCQLTSNLVLKLGDYGLARTLYPEDYCSPPSVHNACNIPLRWMPPDQFALSEPSSPEEWRETVVQPATPESNVWALGVTMWEILSLGTMPFCNLPSLQLYEAIISAHAKHTDTTEQVSLQLSNPCSDSTDNIRQQIFHCVTRCMHVDASLRPSAAQVERELQKLRQSAYQKALTPHFPTHNSTIAYKQTTATPDQELTPTRKPSALKKRSVNGQSRAKKRVEFKEGSQLTEIRNIERVTNQQQQQGSPKKGLRLASMKPEFIDPLAQFDHLADLKFEEEDGDDDDDDDETLTMFPLATESEEVVDVGDGTHVTDIDALLSIASKNYVDTLQRKRKKRKNVDSLLPNGGSDGRHSHMSSPQTHFIDQRENGGYTFGSSGNVLHGTSGNEASSGASSAAPGEKSPDDVMIW